MGLPPEQMSPTLSIPKNDTFPEFPPKADLRKDVSSQLPEVTPGTIDPVSMGGDTPTVQARAVLDTFSEALVNKDIERFASCFHTEQAFWRDFVALTSHLRTFTAPHAIAAVLLHLASLRDIQSKMELVGDALFVCTSPVMMFIDCNIPFRTSSPALECMGRMIHLPVKSDGDKISVCWKIWVLSTWVENLAQFPENEALLLAPGRDLTGVETIETDVCIVGAGTQTYILYIGLVAAARLKALSVESVILDRNSHVGDSWSSRYDCLRIHVPTSNCEMPYTRYPKELQSPHLFTKDEVAAHLRQYATNFSLNVILSSVIQGYVYSPSEKRWKIKCRSGDGSLSKIITCKHFVQATGLGSGKPYVPPMEHAHLYKGLSIRATQFRNGQVLAEQGVKSVAIVGSANTAFDVMTDCYEAGLETTIVARSPTYIFPYEYLTDPRGIGIYDVLPLDAADRVMSTLPTGVDGQLSHALFAHLASQEPDRYHALSKAGFPVLDSRDPSVNLLHHLLERAGGHYVDIGGTELVAQGKVAVRGLVEPLGYTETGLRLSGGSLLDVDAVIWCTGFADKDVRDTAREVLGNEEGNEEEGEDDNKEGLLHPADIAARLDATWGVDAEGEVRGMWKRHLRVENYWFTGGAFMHQRWGSQAMAQQIKLDLEGCSPPVYRERPDQVEELRVGSPNAPFISVPSLT